MHALPAWVYDNGELTRLELQRVLLPSWQIVCHINSIPKAGDFETFDLGPESIFVLRDREGTIRAFHNVCRHRGARILDGAGNCPATITCPYHGWTYRHDGGLIGMPVRESFPGIDRGEHGLRPVKVDIAFGFVFICLAGDPPKVSDTWGKFVDEFLPYRTAEMVPLGPISQESWPVDWKIAMDNYLESYHVPIGHPGLNRMFTPDYEDQASVPGVARGLSWLREPHSARWSEGHYQRLVGKVATHLPEAARRCWRFYSALPNLGIDVFPEQMDFFQVLPDGPGRCIVRGGVFGLPDDRREMRALRYLGSRINTQVNNEDKWLCARVQRGLASGSYTPGPLSKLERWMLEFHDLLRSRIPEFKLPSATTAVLPNRSPVDRRRSSLHCRNAVGQPLPEGSQPAAKPAPQTAVSIAEIEHPPAVSNAAMSSAAARPFIHRRAARYRAAAAARSSSHQVYDDSRHTLCPGAVGNTCVTE